MKKFYLAGLLFLLFMLCITWKVHAQMEKLRFEHININNGLSHNDVMEIRQDSKGYIWIGTLDGLNKYDGYHFTTYQHEPHNTASLTTNAVSGIWEDVDGTFWIHPVNSDLNKFSPATESFSIANPLPGKNFKFDPRLIQELEADKEGMIWVYNQKGKGQLCRFDRTNNRVYDEDFSSQILNNPYNSSDAGKTIHDIFRDKSGELWFGTFGGGLCRFNPETETFTAFTIKQGLPGNTIHSIQEDDKGNLWLATGNGLSKFSITHNICTNYDIKDGLQSNQFTVGHTTPGASYKGRDGTLYFGGIKGLNVFHPKYLQRNQYIPPVVINQFKLFDTPVPGKQVAKEIELKHDQNFFSFEFAALDYTNSQKNQYASKLEGVDKDWVQSGTRRYASYTGVAPGKYTFRVKGTNSDGVWNEKDTSIAVIIRPPWWRTGWAYAFYALCFLVSAFTIHKFQRKRLIRIERERGREKELKQAKEIEKAYHELKTTQQQLIQSEKMASLGELTAGIAHEIQNPLNFVNNFSEVNTELIDEMQQEMDKGNLADAKAIAKDIKDNEQKINHHGKRADAIVKGMLQHSRSSGGIKEPTNINALADEYLRLAYHGLRAKDKSFNAALKTDFDESIGNINIIPQDFGRAVLNLITNAFYAVSEKKKQHPDDFEPIVSVSTKKINGKPGSYRVQVSVKDNGNGIPQKILDKIFQPFFTTKPTGQGTGLGLSLSYDIVKAHGGELKVETKEGEGSEFIIQLPV